MCIKQDQVRDEGPLSVSFFWPKHWNLKKPVDAASQMADIGRVNGTANLPEVRASDRVISNTTTAAVSSNQPNKTLVYQIQLEDFKDESNRDACEFEMRIESINDQKLFGYDPQPSYFTMESTANSDGLSRINVYLDTSSDFESALVHISCTYKSVVLHRSVLQFSQDNI